MKRTKLLRLLLLFSLSMNLAVVAAFAYQQHEAPEEGCLIATGPPAEVFAELELSQEQLAEFERLRAEFRGHMGDCHRSMRVLREELLTELAADAPDVERIDRVLVGMRDQQFAAQRQLVEHILDLSAALRPEQRTKFQLILGRRMLGCGSNSHGAHDGPFNH